MSLKMSLLREVLKKIRSKRSKRFSNRSSGSKGSSSKKEDQKSCFNCKKPGHFIAECPDLQKDKSKEK
jgi:hypothetical protein